MARVALPGRSKQDDHPLTLGDRRRDGEAQVPDAGSPAGAAAEAGVSVTGSAGTVTRGRRVTASLPELRPAEAGMPSGAGSTARSGRMPAVSGLPNAAAVSGSRISRSATVAVARSAVRPPEFQPQALCGEAAAEDAHGAAPDDRPARSVRGLGPLQPQAAQRDHADLRAADRQRRAAPILRFDHDHAGLIGDREGVGDLEEHRPELRQLLQGQRQGRQPQPSPPRARGRTGPVRPGGPPPPGAAPPRTGSACASGRARSRPASRSGTKAAPSPWKEKT